MFYSVMLSLAVLILVGSFCHCTSAKSIEGDWSSLDPLHDEQQDARIATLSASQLLTELVFRLDIVECPVAEPSQNTGHQYYAHAFYSTSLGRYSCWGFQSNPPQQLLFDDSDILFITNTKVFGNYQNARIELYHIACPENRLGSIIHSEIDLQEREKIGDQSVCLDYVRLEDKDKGTFYELCGIETVGLNFPKFSSLFVTFRSGFSQTKTGFKIGIACMLEPPAINQEVCLQDSMELSVQDYLEEENDFNHDENKQREAFSVNRKLIPFGAKEKLLAFYKSHRYHRGHTSSSSYKRILSLAQMARNSCDSILAKVAEGVLKIFQ